MGCGKSTPSSPKLYLDVVEYHNIKKEINVGFNQDYFAKRVTKTVLRLSQNKKDYDKESRERIDQLVVLLLKKRERLDSQEEYKSRTKRNLTY